MHIKDLLQRFEETQAKKMIEQNELLGRGGAADWNDYRQRVGENRGRRLALDDLRSMVDQLLKEGDDNDE